MRTVTSKFKCFTLIETFVVLILIGIVSSVTYIAIDQYASKSSNRKRIAQGYANIITDASKDFQLRVNEGSAMLAAATTSAQRYALLKQAGLIAELPPTWDAFAFDYWPGYYPRTYPYFTLNFENDGVCYISEHKKDVTTPKYGYKWREGSFGDCRGNYSTFSSWGNWSTCDIGSNTQERTRTCNNDAAGTRTRQVWCERSDGKNMGSRSSVYSYPGCELAVKPTTSIPCSRGCDPSAAVSETRSCTTASYSWVVSEWSSCSGWSAWSKWSPCSSPCAGGSQSRSRSCLGDANATTQSRTAVCQATAPDGSTSIVDDSFCGLKPAITQPCRLPCEGSATETRSCNTEPCSKYQWTITATSACSGDWDTWSKWSSWSACSVKCGGGTQSRSRSCSNDSKGSQERTIVCTGTSSSGQSGKVPDANCSSLAKPSATIACSRGCDGASTQTQTCNTDLCYSYVWETSNWSSSCSGTASTWGAWSAWSACNKPCGSGSQTQSRSCNNELNGTQTRTVVCKQINSSGMRVDIADSYCSSKPKPDTSQSCSVPCVGEDTQTQACITQPCETYAWVAGNWGACGGTYSSWNEWTSYSDCTKPCGEGTQEKTRTCKNNSAGVQDRPVTCQKTDFDGVKTTVADNYCTGTKPTSSRACSRGCTGSNTKSITCNTQACYTYAWSEGNWGACGGTYSTWNEWAACSANCGGGTQYRTCSNNAAGKQTRTVVCKRTYTVDNTTKTVTDSNCNTTKPATTQTCALGCSGPTSQSCNTQSCVTSYTGQRWAGTTFTNNTTFGQNTTACLAWCQSLRSGYCMLQADSSKSHCRSYSSNTGLESAKNWPTAVAWTITY